MASSTPRVLFWTLMALSWTLVASAAEARWRSADAKVHIMVDGIDRTYVVHAPRMAQPAGGFPVVLAFHGGGGTAESMVRLTRLNDIADARGLVIVYPDGIDRHWNDGRSTIKNKTDDVAFVRALLDDVGRNYPIDRGRVFATGISNGALFTQRLGCELAGEISAIAPVAGPMAADLASRCQPVRPVAVLQIEGDADPIIPYNGGKVADFGGRGEGGLVLSTQETVALWGRMDGCTGRSPVETLPPPQQATPDGTQVTRMHFLGCHAGAQVVLLTILGGGHTWPGGPQYAPRFIIGKASSQLDASATIVDFFLSDRSTGMP